MYLTKIVLAAVGVLGAILVGVAAQAFAAPQGPWVKPDSDLSAPGQDASRPQISTAPDGTTTAVWQRSDGSRPVIQASTRPPGGTFGTPVDLSAPGGGNAVSPRITTAPDGTTTVVWQRDDNSNWIVQAATRPPGGPFAAAVDLSAPGQSAQNPEIAAAPDGTVTAVWSRGPASEEVIQAATRPPGGSFGSPVDLSIAGPGQNARDPRIATAADGTTTAVWSRDNGSVNVIQATTRPPGGSFGPPVRLSTLGQNADVPQISTAPDGTETVVWIRSNGSNDIAQAATRPPGGSFGTPENLSAAGHDSFAPQVTTSPDGTTTAVWVSLYGNYIVQAATRPPGGSFGVGEDISAFGGDATSAQINTAPDGTATVVWSRDDSSNRIAQASTRPPGGSFGNPEDLSAPGQDAFSPQITTASDGTATAVWSRSNGSNSIIQSISTVRPSVLLQVNRSGNRDGTVTSDLPGITCGTDCAEIYPSLTAVTLTAVADAGSTFTGWTGEGCSGTGTCQVSMSEARTVTATFAEPKLANLKITPKTKKVKPGKKATFKVVLKNFGGATAKNPKVCAKGPKKLLKLPKCRKPGNLAAGKSKTVKLKITAKKSTKKGKKPKVTFTATASGGLKKTGKATVVVK